jgi:ATP-dependent RNA helicase DeaD
MLREIERYTGQRIEPMRMPSRADVAARRVALFKESLRGALAEGGLDPYLALVQEVAEEGPFEMAEVAAAAARLAGRERPLAVSVEPEAPERAPGDGGTVRLFLNAGRESGVRAADIVGAIANETGVPGADIGGIEIFDRFAFLELPARHAERVMSRMAGVRIRNRPVTVTLAVPRGQIPDAPPGDAGERGGRPRKRPGGWTRTPARTAERAARRPEGRASRPRDRKPRRG